MSGERFRPVGVLSMRVLRVRAAVCAMMWALGALPVAAQTPALDEPTVIILVRNVMLALAHANQTGNFSVFRDLGSAKFQQENSTVHLTDLYAGLRQNNIDLTPLAIVEPQFTRPVGLTPSGELRLTGLFPTTPYQVQFDMAFEPSADRWRISALAIQLATAPAAEAEAAVPGDTVTTTVAPEPAAGQASGGAPSVQEFPLALPQMPRLPKPKPAAGSN
jgi:hypothetical protein